MKFKGMANIHRTSKQQKSPTEVNLNRKKGIWASSLALPVCFLLALLLVTTVVPAIATSPTSPISLQQSADIAQQSTTSQWLQQGKQRYQAGQFREAATLWEQAVQGYRDRQEPLNQSLALNHLSLAYQQLGQWQQAQNAIEQSINLLKNIKQLDTNGTAILAQALNARGRMELAKGNTEAAFATWQQAEAAYTRADNENGKLGSRMNQALALQSLGQYRRAKNLLEQINAQLQNQPDTLLKADSLRSLAFTLQTIGDLVKAKEILEQSWTISDKLNSPADTSATLFSLGNLAKIFQDDEAALIYYQEAAKLAVDDLTKVQALLNQFNLLIALEAESEVKAIVPEIQAKLANLSPSRDGVYARVNFAENLMKMQQRLMSQPEMGQLLATAVKQAKELGDRRAEAYALTEVGKLYEQNRQWQDAQVVSEQALQIVQGIDADDIVARAAWQLGRILRQQGEITGAIAAYDRSFKSLQLLRSDLVAINREIQFEFRETIEPVYREFVSVLLNPAQEEISQTNLKKAREVMEGLQLAELDNFFGDACLKTRSVQIDNIDTQAAVIYPIILSDRLEVILSIPNQPLHHYTTQLSNDKVEATLEQVYSSLSPGYPRDEHLRLSEQVYNWLIKPAETVLKSSNIKTLVFVPDGFFRNLPMAALYDGNQYLIAQYNVAFSPGLQLFAPGLKGEKLSVLAAGLTEARQGFNPLPGVAGEVAEIKTEIPSKVLLNGEFTSASFKQAIDSQPFPVVHLATHGQFSSNPDDTFLLTWSDRISIKDLDLLFQNRKLESIEPIELLVMSACQTAAGDNRATLGLAGFALRSGAKSTIASLWSVSDESTANLMGEFYQQLTANKQISKTEALRQAQLKILQNPQFKHPYFWAAFILVGNWL